MFITEDEIKKRLNSPKNLINSLGLKTVSNVIVDVKARPTPLSTELKVVAGVAGTVLGNKNAATALGISVQQVRSAVNSSDTNIKSLIEQKILDIEQLALDRTIECLGLLKGNIEGEKPKDIAIIAGQMSKVVNNIKGNRGVSDNRTQFIVYAPVMKNEKDYSIIESSVA